MTLHSEMPAARLIFRKWCEMHGIVMDPIAGSDLVQRIAQALDLRTQFPQADAKDRNRARFRLIKAGVRGVCP